MSLFLRPSFAPSHRHLDWFSLLYRIDNGLTRQDSERLPGVWIRIGKSSRFFGKRRDSASVYLLVENGIVEKPDTSIETVESHGSLAQ
jgi:hypothetical protein